MTFALLQNISSGCGATASSAIKLIILACTLLGSSNAVVDASSSSNIDEAHQRCDGDNDICSSSSVQQNNRASDECTLVMAPSGLENGSWGIFTLTSRVKDEVLNNYGDVVIQITDPNPHTAAGMSRLVWDYVWEGQLLSGHYEGFNEFIRLYLDSEVYLMDVPKTIILLEVNHWKIILDGIVAYLLVLGHSLIMATIIGQRVRI